MDRTLVLHRALLQQLESLRQSGVQELPRPGGQSATGTRRAATSAALAESASDRLSPMATAAHALPAGGSPHREVLAADQQREALHTLCGEVAECTLCPALAETRTQTVFGVGNPSARLVFFGEAPGADEDRQGEPFVGRAGQLLTRIIEACGMKREDVYILNVLKCRPPGNRNPTLEEAQNCRPFFERQLEIIDPEFICCLGAIAASTLLESNLSIGRLRGRFHDWRGIRVMATYHPAYLLRNPSAKRLVWEDMKMLMKGMGREVSG